MLAGPELRDVFNRIAAFFLAAGVPKAALLQQLNDSIRLATRSSLSPKFSAEGDFRELERAVTQWANDPHYLNAAGRSKPLRATGKYSIATLVRQANYSGSVAGAIKTLERLGSVKRNSDSTYSLGSRLFAWKLDGSVGYEAQANFLMNAVLAATASANRTGAAKKLFWKTSYSDRIPKALESKFLEYLYYRLDALLFELEDWFGKHEVSAKSRRAGQPSSVVGVGLFPYIQTIRAGSSKSSRKPAS
jgi:hypothetical protein